jgi:iron complex outermembrane receptor protein
VNIQLYSVRPIAAVVLLASATPAWCAQERAEEAPLAEVVITATLRDTPLAELPQSVSVLSADQTRAAGVQHFADVLALVPDLTAAGGSTRPRYFQLRGVGEEDQYQGAPNPSVGFLIDDIDFSGVGMPATLFDLRQIEVLRGPQGTVYGANALAGLISVRTQDPSRDFELHAEASAGNYDTHAAGLALSDGIAAGAGGWRAVVQDYRSDGFRHNAFLGRGDTNGFDEQTVRGKFFWELTPALRADVTLMHVNLNNGYDAWSIDNSRTTQSDQPGRDAQLSNGGALRLTATGLSFGELRSVSSAADSKIHFSFDADWGNDAFWATRPGCTAADCTPYDYFTGIERRRRTAAEDLRLLGDDEHRLFGRVRWLLGAYALRLTEANDEIDTARAYYLNDPTQLYVTGIDSRYAATNTAVYGSLDGALGAYDATLGLRGEQRRASYSDSNDVTFAPIDHMLGGNLTLSRHFDAQDMGYVALARGYKAGGFNISASLPPDRRQFNPEYLWNFELGIKHQGEPLQFDADVFYMRRQAMQVNISYQVVPDDPSTFGFFTANAARGDNYGLESSLDWLMTPRWRLHGNLSLLRTRFIGYSYIDQNGNLFALSGRAQPYAPGYEAALALDYHHPQGWFARVDVQAVDGYYFDASDDQVARAHQLVNLRAGYERGRWSASAWIRNAFNRYYALHGFYFGNEPPDFPNKLYLQAGDPRAVGVTLRYDLGARE